jgi:hypothetical protein
MQLILVVAHFALGDLLSVEHINAIYEAIKEEIVAA